MSFSRKEEGNKIWITVNKDFSLSEEVTTVPCEDALHLLLSRKVKKVTSARKVEDEIVVTRHYCTCPICGNTFAAYMKVMKKEEGCSRAAIRELCDEQISLFPDKTVDYIRFHKPLEYGDVVSCSYCGRNGRITNRKINCAIVIGQDRLEVTCYLRHLFRLANSKWIHGAETMTFDRQTGKVLFSLRCGKRTIARKQIISAKSLDIKDPWLLMFKNKRIFREIKRSFERVFGMIPFVDRLITLDSLILLTAFVGYQADFYHAIPLSFDDNSELYPKEFESIAERLHFADNVPKILANTDIPLTKSVKRIVYQRPALLFYDMELERIWKIINNLDCFCALLRLATINVFLAYFHIYVKTDDYLADVRCARGAAWLQREIASKRCLDLFFRGSVYAVVNDRIRQQLLKTGAEMDVFDSYCIENKLYFSVPMTSCPENEVCSVVSGFQFKCLCTKKEYYLVGKTLHNCLGQYWPSETSQVFVVSKAGKAVAAIEVMDHTVTTANCDKNRRPESIPLVDAIIRWAENNMYSIGEEVL